MPLLVVGISHQSAPLPVLERFALNSDQGEQMLEQLTEYTPQGVVLATCNRTEIYAHSHMPDIGAQHLQRFLAQWSGSSWDEISPYLYSYAHWPAVEHLFRVAGGLDSMVIGEEQILGQVRNAMEQAKARGSLDIVLGKAFQSAIRAGRRVRAETTISRNAVSVSSVAVGLAKRHFGDLGSLRVLLISAGEAGKLASRSLVAQGVRHLEVTSRSFERAVALADRMGGQAIPFHQMETSLEQADLVITATSAPDHVLTLAQMRRVMVQRHSKPQVLVDIAVPRDVDPEVAAIEGLSLYNIEDIQRYVDDNLLLRTLERDDALSIIDEEVKHFQEWWRSQEVRPTIAALRRKAESIREQELRKTWRRLPNLSNEERERIEAMSKAIAKKLLHDPFTYLKERRDDEDSIATIQELFGLDIAHEATSHNGHTDTDGAGTDDAPAASSRHAQ